MQTVNIVADDRERPSGIVESLRTHDGVTVSVARLKTGDYLVDESMTVERKTFPDFCQSLVDGRLFQQAVRLASSPGRPLMIMEGASKDPMAFGLRREAVQGAWVTLTFILGLPLLYSRDPEETARLIVFAGRQWTERRKGGVKRTGYRPKGRRKRQAYILQGLPGIGPIRAERLLDAFGSVEAVFAAKADALAAVPGIGKAGARAIREILE